MPQVRRFNPLTPLLLGASFEEALGLGAEYNVPTARLRAPSSMRTHAALFVSKVPIRSVNQPEMSALQHRRLHGRTKRRPVWARAVVVRHRLDVVAPSPCAQGLSRAPRAPA